MEVGKHITIDEFSLLSSSFSLFSFSFFPPDFSEEEDDFYGGGEGDWLIDKILEKKFDADTGVAPCFPFSPSLCFSCLFTTPSCVNFFLIIYLMPKGHFLPLSLARIF